MAVQINTLDFGLDVQLLYELVKSIGNPAWNKQLSTELASLTNGTAVDQCDRLFYDEFTITSASSKVYDLSGDAAFQDPVEKAITFARIKIILVVIEASANPVDADVTVGQAAANSVVTWAVPIRNTTQNDGVFVCLRTDATGIVVTAGTGDNFRINNPGTKSVTGYTMIAGSSA